MRVLFAGGGTGGHLYPGLAIARALVRIAPRAEPFFIGARRGIERDVLPGSGFPFVLLDLHPLYRARPWENWRTVRGVASAWRGVSAVARESAPAALVATGGYAAGVALAWAVAHAVPIAIQEQNSYPGLTVRLFARWAREIYLGFPEAGGLLSRGSATLLDTGNPIEPPPSPRPGRATARQRWGFPQQGGRVLLVFGGSQGARAINAVVGAWLDQGLPPDLYLIWGTGKRSYDDFARYESERVRVRPYLTPMAEAYAATDLAIARAGAMGTAEMCAWGIPSILVPLPTAAADHQTVNARTLVAAGAALMLAEEELSAGRLDAMVKELMTDPERLSALSLRASARGRPDSAEIIANRIVAMGMMK